MYSGITKIYYRKTIGHVFTKPVQIEGTTQTFFSPLNCFSSYFTFLPLGDASVCSRPLTAEDDVERVRASFLHSPKMQLRSYRRRK
jgi:hypothetical protein